MFYTDNPTPGRCPVLVSREGSFRTKTCNKPVKGTLKDETEVCGVHLAVERKREEAKEQRQIEQQMRLNRQAKANDVVEVLRALGVTSASPHRFGNLTSTDRVVVNAQQIIDLLTKEA